MHTWKTLPFCHHLRLGYINKLLLSGFLPKVSMTAAKLLYRLGTVALILYDSKVILKILQARLQHYVNWELPDVQTGFRKGRETRDRIVNIHWIMEKAREFQKNIYLYFIDYTKAFDCVDHNKCGKFLKTWAYQTILLVSWEYVGQEATVRTRHGKTDSFKTGKGVW